MFELKRGSSARCLLVWLTATTLASAVVAWSAPDLAAAHNALTGTPGPQSFDAWLTRLCAAVTTLCAAWGWVVTSIVVVEALAGRPRQARTPGVPGWARRLVLTACGVAVLGAGVPAVAAPEPTPDHHDRRGRPTVLDGLPLPERAEGRSVSEAVARAITDSPSARPTAPPTARPTAPPTGSRSEPAPARPAPSTSGEHLVRSGDSLWTIAAASLSGSLREATDAEVAAYWPEIYALNRGRLGPDPDLLLPGQRLRLPDRPLPSPTPPTTREDDR